MYHAEDGEAAASCLGDSSEFDAEFEECVKRDYPKTWEYMGTLEDDLISSGETIATTPVIWIGEEVYGTFTRSTGLIKVNVDVHERWHPDVDDRNHELGQTTIHEKIHKQDWEEDGAVDLREETTDIAAGTVLEELFGTSINRGCSCDVNWSLQEGVIY